VSLLDIWRNKIPKIKAYQLSPAGKGARWRGIRREIIDLQKDDIAECFSAAATVSLIPRKSKAGAAAVDPVLLHRRQQQCGVGVEQKMGDG
jgi:hypothetical protein